MKEGYPVESSGQGEEMSNSDMSALFDQFDQNVNFDRRSETAAKLLDYYASTDQKFMYTTRSGPQAGTFSDMYAVCPAVEDIIDLGFEKAVSALGVYEISEEQFAALRNPSEQVDDESKEDDELENKPYTGKETPPEKSEEISKRAEAVAQATETVHQQYTKEGAATQVVSTEVIQSTEQQGAAVIAPSEVSDGLQQTSLPEVAENAATPLPNIPLAVGDGTMSREESITEDYAKKTSTSIEAVDMSGEINDALRFAVEPTPVDKEVTDTVPLPLSRGPIDTTTFVSIEQKEERTDAELDETLYETSKEIEVSTVDKAVREEVSPGVEAIFEEHEKYDIDTLEDSSHHMETSPSLTVVEMDNVASLQPAESAEDAANELPEHRETVQSFQSVYEHENETQSDIVEDPETLNAAVEVVTGFIETEPEFESSMTPAEVAKYGEVIQQSIKKLEQAETKEACAEHVEALQKSLAELLESLGFARSQELAHQLVRQYDTKTLRQFIAALLKSVTAGEVAQHGLQKKVLPMNHHWFGKRVVERVVRAAATGHLQAV